MKIEKWNGHDIRFVEHNGAWWAVAADVTNALNLKQTTRALEKIKDGVTTSKVIDRLGREQEANIINEKAIYRLSFKSKKKEAEAFQDWIFDVIKKLRQSAGLEGFEVFKMLDKEQQRAMMKKLDSSLVKASKVDYIKANTIANKVVSNLYGYTRMIKKAEMQPDMLVKRQSILDETVNLMAMNSIFNLGISVSDKIYEKYKLNDIVFANPPC
ncbi:phage repressor protein [Sedimentibacter hydroxybenzoicus DSM 7310]|uniref:Phage repressor protein n=1 Tax=Sedimentibacter hydroxybenzoicus DSM 7310 TaxID=1123245 RepID=A0A974BIA1_SEDHY|nr:BRO family protein [Sedimentibacter hydroxybenzoicus]NYB73411.1 phage repressor protein [Sedimentibacter hydroxybenzoicus DSM 7310]